VARNCAIGEVTEETAGNCRSGRAVLTTCKATTKPEELRRGGVDISTGKEREKESEQRMQQSKVVVVKRWL